MRASAAHDSDRPFGVEELGMHPVGAVTGVGSFTVDSVP